MFTVFVVVVVVVVVVLEFIWACIDSNVVVVVVAVHVAVNPDLLTDPSEWNLTVIGVSATKDPGMKLPQNFWLKDP